MEGAEFVLAHKTNPRLLVILTFSKGHKPQWEYTEDFHSATFFANEFKADERMILHRCPRTEIRLRPRQNAHSDWLATGQDTIKPQQREY